MICDPCRDPHPADACVDSIAGREYPQRHCACQHQPRPPSRIPGPGTAPPTTHLPQSEGPEKIDTADRMKAMTEQAQLVTDQGATP